MKGDIIALRGAFNTGKSSTLKLLHELLITKYSDSIDEYQTFEIDIKVVMIINGVKIGIGSQGDIAHQLEDSLNYFKSIGCNIIICATRGWGNTVRAVEAMENEYIIEFVPKDRVDDNSNWEHANREKAEELLAKVEAIVFSS